MNLNKLTHHLILGIMTLAVGLAVWPCRADGQETREPLTRTEVVRLLENGVAPDRVGALAKQYGISFQVTEENESLLRAAGANDELIGMLKALAPSEKAPAAAPAAPAPQPAKVEPPKPAEPVEPPKFILREGTEVKLKFAQDLNSKTAREGDPVKFIVADDIWVGDKLVVRSGASARGEVSHVQSASLIGKSGELSVRLSYVKVADGRVLLRGSRVKEQQGSTGTLGVLLAPLGLLKPGKQIEVKEGTSLTAYVDEDVSLPAAP